MTSPSWVLSLLGSLCFHAGIGAYLIESSSQNLPLDFKKGKSALLMEMVSRESFPHQKTKPLPPKPIKEIFLEKGSMPSLQPISLHPKLVQMELKRESEKKRSPQRETKKEEGSLEEKGVFVSAQLLGEVQPNYPRYSRRHGEEGKVILRVGIHETGRVEKLEIIQSSGYVRLDKAAMQAFEEASFKAAREGGREIYSHKTIAFKFKLS